MTDATSTLELTSRELALLLKYGLPFDEEAEQLRSSKVRNGMHVAQVDPYWISMWTADIVRSAKKLRSQSPLEELDALCDVLENAENHDRRVRGVPRGWRAGAPMTCKAADLRTVTPFRCMIFRVMRMKNHVLINES